MRGKFSKIHSAIAKYGFENIFAEYKRTNIRQMRQKYNVSDNTLQKIFGPKMTKSKKRIIQILLGEGEQGKIKEIAGKNIL